MAKSNVSREVYVGLCAMRDACFPPGEGRGEAMPAHRRRAALMLAAEWITKLVVVGPEPEEKGASNASPRGTKR